MRQAGTRRAALLAALSLLLADALSGCAPEEAGIPDFQGMPWGTQAADIVRAAQSEDFFLVRWGEDCSTLLGFDREGALVMGSFVPSPAAPEERETQVEDALAELTRQLGQPAAGMFRDSGGAPADSWQAALADGGTAQFTWLTSDAETCHLDIGDGPLRVTLTAPGVPREGAEFQGFAWGTPVEEIASQADWSSWRLVQGIVPVGGVNAAALYVFDGDGGLRRGRYLFPGEDAAAGDAAWQAALSWLAETYGLTPEGEDSQDLRWTVGPSQVALTREGDAVRLSLAGDGAGL